MPVSVPRLTAPCFFFFNDTATTEIYTLSLHDALPISAALRRLSLDQALVLQLLEGGVDRPRAGLPDAATALGDLLDQLVAIPRLLGEQRQRRGSDVTAPHARPTVHPALGPPGADTEAHRAPGTPGAATAPRAAGPATACAATPPATAPVFLAGCPVFGSVPAFVMFMHLRTPVLFVVIRQSKKTFFFSDTSTIYR